MRLAALLGGDPAPAGAEDTEVTGLAYDNRRVEPGALFFCVPGFTADGHDFAPAAVARGAVALVVERELAQPVPQVRVESVREAMGPMAARFHGDPSARLRVCGVTGTNGKTTTAFLVRSLLEHAGRQTALMGTVKSVVGGHEREVARTTPEAIDLQADMAEMLAAGDRFLSMEVSSHALELRRVDGIRFAAAIFTNLSRDHLDFHPDMEAYYRAKARLFELAGAEQGTVSVVNADDPHGARLAREHPEAVTFALDSPADYTARDVAWTAAGASFTLATPAGDAPVSLPLPGRFNVANALGAVAAVHGLGVGLAEIAAALPSVGAVPGRLEPVDEGQPFAVLVDYAHTPDSLANVLDATRALTRGRLVCVFGCGGDRDRGKRPLMGRVAHDRADVVLVTSDNPRSEDPEAIVAEVLAGIDEPLRPGRLEAIVDRREAIERAVALARAGDVVLVAGKGHEQGQELADGRKVAFDDVEVAREALRDVGNGA